MLFTVFSNVEHVEHEHQIFSRIKTYVKLTKDTPADNCIQNALISNLRQNVWAEEHIEDRWSENKKIKV